MKELLNKILDETVAYYDTIDKLAKDIEPYSCEYLAENGNKCAVGRYFTDNIIDDIRTIKKTIPEQLPITLINLSEAIGGDVFDFDSAMDLKDVLIDEVKDVPISFWSRLQNLHDLDLHQPGVEISIDRIRADIDKGYFYKRY